MRLSQILFPTDFSGASEAAGQVAREMALQAGARLHVAYVVPPVTDPGGAAQRLTRLGAALGGRLAVETALLSGRVAREILAYARDKRIDLIVLGTHGRTGVSHVILGSIAETVVRLAPCRSSVAVVSRCTMAQSKNVPSGRGKSVTVSRWSSPSMSGQYSSAFTVPAWPRPAEFTVTVRLSALERVWLTSVC